MKKLVIAVALVQSLSGCALAFHAANGSLGDVLGLPSSVEVSNFGDGTGYQPKFTVEVPGGVCNKAAFVDGFKDDYVTGWNDTVHEKMASAQAQLKKKPKDKVAQQSLQSYRDRLIGTKGYSGNAAKYPAPTGYAGAAETCGPNSYAKGKSASVDALARDRKSLEGQM